MDQLTQKLLSTGGGSEPTPPLSELFSAVNYTGDSTYRNIDVGLNMIGAVQAGGSAMAFIKKTSSGLPLWFDTERGVREYLISYSQQGESNRSDSLYLWSTTGYNIGDWTNINANNANFATLNFISHPDFFNVITWRGDASTLRAIPHGMNERPKFIIVKAYQGNNGQDWVVWHQSLSPSNRRYLRLNTNNTPTSNTTVWGDTAPDSTNFYVGNNLLTNGSNIDYVAYVWGGPYVSAGTYSSNNSVIGPSVDAGITPVFALTKNGTSSFADQTLGAWLGLDTTTGWQASTSGSDVPYLLNNINNPTPANYSTPTSVGWDINKKDENINWSSNTMYYFAIGEPSP